MRHFSLKYLLVLTFSLCLIACVKDKPHPPNYPPIAQGRKALIANEGAFGNGNATLSVYDFDSGWVNKDVFYQVNNQRLGDVLQSICVVDNYIFLLVNNSDRITVIKKSDYSFVKNIAVQKPRYMLKVAANKAYITSLYRNKINILNLETLEITDSIMTDYPNTEGMILQNGSVYVANWNVNCNYIYQINPLKDSIAARIPIAGFAPQQMVVDKQQHLWVLAGNKQKQKQSSLTQINTSNNSILQLFIFPTEADIMKPVMNPTKDTLYFLGVDYNGGSSFNGVFRMATQQAQMPTQPFIPAQALQYFWGLGIDSTSGNIFVGDPKGFIQQGTVYIYQPNGTKIHSFETGVGPGFFLFE